LGYHNVGAERYRYGTRCRNPSVPRFDLQVQCSADQSTASAKRDVHPILLRIEPCESSSRLSHHGAVSVDSTHGRPSIGIYAVERHITRDDRNTLSRNRRRGDEQPYDQGYRSKDACESEFSHVLSPSLFAVQASADGAGEGPIRLIAVLRVLTFLYETTSIVTDEPTAKNVGVSAATATAVWPLTEMFAAALRLRISTPNGCTSASVSPGRSGTNAPKLVPPGGDALARVRMPAFVSDWNAVAGITAEPAALALVIVSWAVPVNDPPVGAVTVTVYAPGLRAGMVTVVVNSPRASVIGLGEGAWLTAPTLIVPTVL